MSGVIFHIADYIYCCHLAYLYLLILREANPGTAFNKVHCHIHIMVLYIVVMMALFWSSLIVSFFTALASIILFIAVIKVRQLPNNIQLKAGS